MKFCYCPECKELHPKNWYSRGTCDRCNGPCSVIAVPTSIIGYLMFFFSILALVLIVIYLTGIGWASPEYVIIAIFGSLTAAFACSFIEIGRGTALAKERIRKRA